MSQVTTNLQIDFSEWVFAAWSTFLSFFLSFFFFFCSERKNKIISRTPIQKCIVVSQCFGDGNEKSPKGGRLSSHIIPPGHAKSVRFFFSFSYKRKGCKVLYLACYLSYTHYPAWQREALMWPLMDRNTDVSKNTCTVRRCRRGQPDAGFRIFMNSITMVTRQDP